VNPVSDEHSVWEIYSQMEYVFIPWIHWCGMHALICCAGTVDVCFTCFSL